MTVLLVRSYLPLSITYLKAVELVAFGTDRNLKRMQNHERGFE